MIFKASFYSVILLRFVVARFAEKLNLFAYLSEKMFAESSFQKFESFDILHEILNGHIITHDSATHQFSSSPPFPLRCPPILKDIRMFFMISFRTSFFCIVRLLYVFVRQTSCHGM